VTTDVLTMGPLDVRAVADRILDQVERAVVGKRDALELVLAGFIADGHVLLEDLPGVAKTLAATTFARATSLAFSRIQFTPDLMPADVTGSSLLDARKGVLDFRPGPIFGQLVLADEVNRAPAKTQAALLEAMQERQVTADGETRLLPKPFLVIATQNPIEYEGTYALPEAQLDRFLLRTSFGYPDADAEWEMLDRRMIRKTDLVDVDEVATAADVLAMQRAVEDVFVAPALGRYLVELVRATRASSRVLVGASPRGALALLKLTRARAALDGRDFALPDDVQRVAGAALAHRLVLRTEHWVRGVTGDEIVREVLDAVPAPPATDLERR
jgi:MoxR-like ATPase